MRKVKVSSHNGSWVLYLVWKQKGREEESIKPRWIIHSKSRSKCTGTGLTCCEPITAWTYIYLHLLKLWFNSFISLLCTKNCCNFHNWHLGKLINQPNVDFTCSYLTLVGLVSHSELDKRAGITGHLLTRLQQDKQKNSNNIGLGMLALYITRVSVSLDFSLKQKEWHWTPLIKLISISHSVILWLFKKGIKKKKKKGQQVKVPRTS